MVQKGLGEEWRVFFSSGGLSSLREERRVGERRSDDGVRASVVFCAAISKVWSSDSWQWRGRREVEEEEEAKGMNCCVWISNGKD